MCKAHYVHCIKKLSKRNYILTNMYRALLTLFLTLLIIFNGSLFSQEPITLLNESEIDIGKNVQIFNDSSHNLEIKDILKYDIQVQFEYCETGDINIPSGSNTIWIKFKVKNFSDVSKTYYLELKKLELIVFIFIRYKTRHLLVVIWGKLTMS